MAERASVGTDLATVTARRDAALAEIGEQAGKAADRRTAVVADEPADLIDLYERLRAPARRGGRRGAAPRPLRGLPPAPEHGRPQRHPRRRRRTRCCAARNAAGSWSGRTSPGCDPQARRRGGRRLARQPWPGGVRGAGRRRADRGGAGRAARQPGHHHEQRGRVLRAAGGPARGGRAGAGRRRRGPDGLQAGRRADVGPLEDQGPRACASWPPRPARRRTGWAGSPTPGCRRASNNRADRLANQAMDAAQGKPGDAPGQPGADAAMPGAGGAEVPRTVGGQVLRTAGRGPAAGAQARGQATTTLLLRHGADAAVGGAAVRRARRHPADRRRAAGRRRRPRRGCAERGGIDVIVTRRCGARGARPRRSRRPPGAPLVVDDDLVETDFGKWEGLSFAEAGARSRRR